MVLLWEVTEEVLFYVPLPNARWPRPSISNPQPGHRGQPGELIPSPRSSKSLHQHQGSLEALASRTDLEPSWAKRAARESALLLWPGHFQVHQGNIGMVGGTGRRDSDITSRLPQEVSLSLWTSNSIPPSKDGGRQVINIDKRDSATARVWLKKPFVPLGLVPSLTERHYGPFLTYRQHQQGPMGTASDKPSRAK